MGTFLMSHRDPSTDVLRTGTVLCTIYFAALNKVSSWMKERPLPHRYEAKLLNIRNLCDLNKRHVEVIQALKKTSSSCWISQ